MNAPWQIELHNMSRRYDATFAPEIARLQIAAGEVFCLLGPTGSGKSTLLRLLAGVDARAAGQMTLQGTPLSSQPWPLAVRRRVTLVFQRPLLLSGSVRMNVEYGLRLRQPAKDGRGQSDRVLERMGLAQFADQHAYTLSGGQTQLVALARALVLRPEVLLLDEPTSHLDPANVALVEEIVREENRERGMTVVWATHNLFQARRVSQRLGLLLAGQLVEVGETEEFFNAPGDPRSADFVQGRMIY